MVGNGSQGIDCSEMRIRFLVRKQKTGAPEQADITITNLSNATANKIRNEFKEVYLEAGYEGGAEEIFRGEIVQVRGPGRENPTDTYLNIQAVASPRAHSYAVVNKTLAKGHTFRDQVDAVLEAMKPFGVTAGHIADLGNVKMPRGRALFGMARSQLRTICQSVGASWHITGGKLNIVKNTDSLPGGAIVLNSDTGMVGMPVQTIEGVEVRCLLNPRLKVEGLVKIDEASIQKAKYNITTDENYLVQKAELDRLIAADGIYKILFLNHSGDTRGTDYYSDMICVAASAGVSIAGAQQHVPNPSGN